MDLSRSLATSLLIALAISACSRAQPSDSEADAGKRVFGEHCASCHSLVADTVIVGPSLYRIGERAQDNPLGLEASAYLRRAIVNPRADTAEGFPDLMPVDFERKLTANQLEDLIAYLLTLR